MCLVTNCERKHYARGLCQVHYNGVRRFVMNGKYSWGELEKRGKVLPVGATSGRGELIKWIEREES